MTRLLLALLLSSCSLQNPKPDQNVLLPGEVRSAQAAKDSISIGKSSKADVRAALGQGKEVAFDSGYEVWVYREKPKEPVKDKPQPPRAELVLLFSPSGLLVNAREASSAAGA